MKRAIFLIVTFVIVMLGGKSVFAQGENYATAYQDYISNLGLYNSAYTNYQLVRSQYLSSQTLTAKAKAQDATRSMLQARDQVVASYLTTLKYRVTTIDGINADTRQLVNSQVEGEVSWYQDHKTKLTSAASLEDLVSDSDEAKSQYDQTLTLIYQILGIVAAGKIDHLRSQLQIVVDETRQKVDEINANGDKNTSNIGRWLIEVDNRISRSQEKEIEAQNIISKMKSSDRDKLSTYNSAQTTFEESLQYLKDANGFIKQIVSDIKLAD